MSFVDDGEWQTAITLAVRFLVYVAILILFFSIFALVVKLLGDWETPAEYYTSETATVTATATERNRLLAKETVQFTYGTCEEEEDVELGKCKSSMEDLYDGKICVICYDEQRNCFFVPCGHSITCYHCAQRIKEGESKNCPVCRRFIGKVRKLFLR